MRVRVSLFSAVFLLTHLPLAMGGTASAATASVSSAAALSTQPKLRFLEYNICGGWSGCTTNPEEMHGEVTRRVAKIEREVVTWDADLVFLNEVCDVQFRALVGKLAARGYTGEFRRTVAYHGCVHMDASAGDAEGVAVLAKGPLSGAGFHNLTSPDTPGEQFGMVCADAALQSRKLRACSVHTDPDPAPGRDQNKRLASIVTPWVDGGIPVVIGGDFNLKPEDPGLDRTYAHSGGVGRFHEVDDTDKEYFTASCAPVATRCRSGQNTYDTDEAAASKIDYIFVSADHFTSYAGEVVGHDREVSDHDVLRGQAEWTAPARS